MEGAPPRAPAGAAHLVATQCSETAAAVAELVNERSVGMKVEDNRLVNGKQRIEIAIRKSVRMFALRHKPEKVDDVHETDFQITEALLQNCNRRERLHGCDIPGAGHHHIGIAAVIAGGPVPNADAFGAMLYGVLHRKVLEMLLLIGHDDVDIVARAQAMIGHTQ